SDPAPQRQRLVFKRDGKVEHLIESLSADYARLPEQRVNSHIIGGQRSRVRARGATAGEGSPSFHSNNRFRAADAPRNSGETAGISKRLQVEQDDVGIIVHFPVLKKIIARDISLITNTHKSRDSKLTICRKREYCQTQRATLRRHCDPARRRKYRRK